jgi:HK97 family phage prohead protease
MAERERRTLQVKVEARADEGEPRTLRGYGAVFNQRTDILGLFEEQIAPGAFTAAIGRDDVRALFNHDPNHVLGRSSAGTLRLLEDETGLRYDIDPPDTQSGRDVVTLIARGDVQGSSFSFETEEESWDYPKEGIPLRTITRAKLYDVGPVTFPAYEQTTVSARSRVEATRQPNDTMSRERSRWALASKA